MAGPFKQLVEAREKLKQRIPKFLRVNYARYEKIGDSWRKQRGRHNTIRRSIKGAGNKVSVGYGSPAEARGLHPSGYKEVLVHNVKELDNVDPKTQAIRIAASVGLKKRLEILKVAKERNIYVLNPRIASRLKARGASAPKTKTEQKQEQNKEEAKEESKASKSKSSSETNATKTKNTSSKSKTTTKKSSSTAKKTTKSSAKK